MLINAKCDEDSSLLVHVTTDLPVKGRPGVGGTYMFSTPDIAATSGFFPRRARVSKRFLGGKEGGENDEQRN